LSNNLAVDFIVSWPRDHQADESHAATSCPKQSRDMMHCESLM